MKSRERGITLVDVSIAAVIVIIIVGVAYPGFMVANDTISRSGQKTRLENASDRIRKAIVNEIRTGQLAEISPPGVPPYVAIHPPRTGIPLEKIAEEGTVPWADVTHRLEFRQTGTIHEKEEKVDLNKDGDREDLCAVGVIDYVTPDFSRPITERGRVILGMPDFVGDVDGDGKEDPLFALKDRQFTIRMFMVFRDEKGHHHQTSLVHSIYLRNVQE